MISGLQRRLLLMVGIGAIGVPLTQRVLKNEVFDARQYYVYLGASGPFAVAEPPAGDSPGQLGAPQSTFHPGQWLGWKSNITVEANVRLVGLTRIVRLSDQQVVKSTEVRFQPDGRRAGEKSFFEQLPNDLRPGPYEIKRRGTFVPDHGQPVAEDFPPFFFEVPQ